MKLNLKNYCRVLIALLFPPKPSKKLIAACKRYRTKLWTEYLEDCYKQANEDSDHEVYSRKDIIMWHNTNNPWSDKHCLECGQPILRMRLDRETSDTTSALPLSYCTECYDDSHHK